MTTKDETGLREAAEQAFHYFVMTAGEYFNHYGHNDEPIPALRAALAANPAPAGRCADCRESASGVCTRHNGNGPDPANPAPAGLRCGCADNDEHARGDKYRRAANPAPAGLDVAIATVVRLIETGENRAMATDGPVPHFRGELDDREWRQLWVALSKVRARLSEGTEPE